MGEVWRLRADAAIELSEGDTLKALETLDELIAALTAAGLLEQLIWAHLDRGAALASIDRGRSIEAFAQAAALSADIGAVSQERLAARSLRRLGVRRQPRLLEQPRGRNDRPSQRGRNGRVPELHLGRDQPRGGGGRIWLTGLSSGGGHHNPSPLPAR